MAPSAHAPGSSDQGERWRIALRLLRPRQKTALVLLTCTRIAVGLCDLLLASAMYWLFVLLQGRALAPRFAWMPQTALVAALVASTLVLLRAMLDISSSRSVFRHIQSLYIDLQLRLTQGYSQMDWRHFVQRNRSELSNHAVYTAREAADFYHRCVEMLSGLVIIALMTAALVYQSPKAALGFACALAAFYGIHRFLIRNDVQRAAADRESALRVLQRDLAGLFSSGKEIRAYGNYGFFHSRIQRQAEQMAASNQRAVFLPQVSRMVADQGTMLLFLALIIVVEARQGDTRQLIAVLAFYFVLSRRLLPLISQLSMILGQMESSFENVKIVDAEMRECLRYERSDPRLQSPPDGHILSLENVNFWYAGGERILSNVNLAVGASEIIMLYGASGAGKSSLLNLIAGVLIPEKGTVRVDRESIAYVPQEVPLLDASIRDNLLFGASERADQELMNALRVAGLDEFVRSQPGGFDTAVGDNGALFSGGERQRLGIARAILRGSRLLLLDEATSAVDERSEQRIMENLRATGVAVLLATHRAQNRAFADRVFRLEAGRLIEEQPLHDQGVVHVPMQAGVR